MDSTTQSLESLLGILHSKNTPDAYANGASTQTNHDAVLQKLDSIVVGVCASLDILHAKVDSLCAGMQLIRTELEVPDLQPAINMPPSADATAKPDFVAINVREDAREEPVVAVIEQDITTHVAAVDSDATAATLATLTTLAVPFPLEPEPSYTNSTDILNVLWPGLPKNDHNELDINRIRQEAELVHEVD
jgi:hypothetical protein